MRHVVAFAFAFAGCRDRAASAPRDSGPRDAGTVKDATEVPVKSVPCAPKAADVTLAVDDGRDAVCWAGRCIKLAIEHDTAKVVATPQRPPVWIEAVAIPKLGPKLAASLDVKAPPPAITTDRRLAVVGNSVWNIALDQKITLESPTQTFGSGPAKLVRITPAGKWLVVTWTSAQCRDPHRWEDPYCWMNGQLVDSTGKNRGLDLEYFDPGALGQLDDTLFFVTSRDVPYLSLFDIDTGRRRWELGMLGIAFKILDAVRVRPGLVALLLRDGFIGYRLIDVVASATQPPEITTIRYLPFCEP